MAEQHGLVRDGIEEKKARKHCFIASLRILRELFPDEAN
jgi:hypothetical protein